MKRGFTTIEIVIVLIIAAMIFLVATSAFSRFNRNQALGASAEEIVSVLEQARGQSLASKDDDTYGVHFESDRVVLFRGNSYNPSDAANQTILLSSATTIVNISLIGGGTDLFFRKITGITNESGTVRVALVRDTNASTTISILPTGVIERE